MAPSLGVFSSDEQDKGIKEKISTAIRYIDSQRKELEQLKFRLEERRKAMFDATIKAIEKSDEMRARVLAGEHVELQKITKVVSASELALLHIIVRLETIRDVGDVMVVLTNAFKAVKKIGKSVAEVGPNLEQTASEINGSFTTILAELGMFSPSVNISLTDTPTEIFQKAQNLISERASELENLPRRMQEDEATQGSILDQTKKVALLETEGEDEEGASEEDSGEFQPVLFSKPGFANPEEIESPIDPEFAVRNYMKKAGEAKIDVFDASAQLNLPVDLVEQAYIKVLAEKRFPGNPPSTTKQVSS